MDADTLFIATKWIKEASSTEKDIALLQMMWELHTFKLLIIDTKAQEIYWAPTGESLGVYEY